MNNPQTTKRKLKQASLTGRQMVQASNVWDVVEMLRAKGILIEGIINPKIKTPYKQFYNMKTDRIIVQQVKYE